MLARVIARQFQALAMGFDVVVDANILSKETRSGRVVSAHAVLQSTLNCADVAGDDGIVDGEWLLTDWLQYLETSGLAQKDWHPTRLPQPWMLVASRVRVSRVATPIKYWPGPSRGLD